MPNVLKDWSEKKLRKPRAPKTPEMSPEEKKAKALEFAASHAKNAAESAKKHDHIAAMESHAYRASALVHAGDLQGAKDAIAKADEHHGKVTDKERRMSANGLHLAKQTLEKYRTAVDEYARDEQGRFASK